MICATCGQHINRDGGLYQRGYYWHAACADVRDDVVWFPSGGKLAPETICLPVDNMDQATCPECGAMFDTIITDEIECPCCGETFRPDCA